MAKFKNWPFTSNLAIRLFWPFVGPDRLPQPGVDRKWTEIGPAGMKKP